MKRLTMPFLVVVAGVLLAIALLGDRDHNSAVSASADAGQIRFRIVDASTGRPTAAMVCIRDASDAVRLPPDGRKLAVVGKTDAFYSGVNYDEKDPNWIGPVRKMNGRGDNNDRSYVYGEIRSVPFWHEPVAFQTKSKFGISLEPGTYRIAVSHGMEFVPVRKELKVAAGDRRDVEIELRRWIDLPKLGWYSGDVHVHHPTKTKPQRDFLLSYAEAEDLHVSNVLEMGHHRGTDFKQLGFGKEFRVQRGNLALVSGQEEPRSTFGHVIGLNTTALARDLPTYDFYDLAFKRLQAQNGAVVGFAHFSWNGCDLPRGFPWYVTTEAIEFVELLQFAKINRPDYYDYLNLGFRLTAAAGSDVPWGSTLGECRTFVYTGKKSLDVDAWFEGLRQGRTFVSNGPALFLTVGGKLPGSEIHVKTGAKLRVKVRASGHREVGFPSRLEIVSNDGVLRRKDREKEKKQLEIELDVIATTSRWITASVSCENGAIAHTTPVYLVVGDEPTWSREKGPRIIEKQLAAIKKIEREFGGRGDARSKGVIERLERAKAYYTKLEKAMRSTASK
ncbi:MAG: CehA/McbA family metallohydrolase [Planctomycetota bacterium]